MIINGGSRRAGGWWAKHLQNAEQNERVTLTDIVGLDASTIPDLLHEMEILALNSGSKAQNYFYQANVNPREGEILTPEQRFEAKDLLLENLGLADQPHFVVEHAKAGRVHFHLIAFRIDMERGRAISDSLTAQIHERTARELEIRFDLERGQSVLVPDRDFERPERGAKKHEVFRGAKGGIDPDAVKADARRALERADSGSAFKAALEASGDYALARGDRRDFIIVDRTGGDHSLARRLGMKAKEVRAFMADIDPAVLPSVAQAKIMQQERAAQLERSAPNPISEVPGDSIAKSTKKVSADMDDDITVKQREQRQALEDKQAAVFNEMVADKNKADRFLQDWQRDHENGERNKRQLQEAQWRREAEHDITDVRARATLAAGESRDFVQAVRREGSMITEEHASLQRDIALERDPDKKHLLELKRDIQHADYMALANERVGAMSNLNGDQYKEAIRQREVWEKAATELRQERLELQERMAEREMKAINDAVEQNTAARQQADHRRNMRGNPAEVRFAGQDHGGHTPAPEKAAQAHNGAHPAQSSDRSASADAERPVVSEIIVSSPERPAAEKSDAKGEMSDARQAARDRSDTAEITDSKAAKKAALAQQRTDIEQSIAQGQDRGRGNSR